MPLSSPYQANLPVVLTGHLVHLHVRTSHTSQLRDDTVVHLCRVTQATTQLSLSVVPQAKCELPEACRELCGPYRPGRVGGAWDWVERLVVDSPVEPTARGSMHLQMGRIMENLSPCSTDWLTACCSATRSPQATTVSDGVPEGCGERRHVHVTCPDVRLTIACAHVYIPYSQLHNHLVTWPVCGSVELLVRRANTGTDTGTLGRANTARGTYIQAY